MSYQVRGQTTSFEPVCDQLRTSFEPDRVMEFGFEPVCGQLQTSLEVASVMEFGFNCVQCTSGLQHLVILWDVLAAAAAAVVVVVGLLKYCSKVAR